MSTPTWTWVSRTHINKWDPAQARAVPGWDLHVRWTATGTVLQVFVPDTDYTPANVLAAILAAGHLDDEVAATSGASAGTA